MIELYKEPMSEHTTFKMGGPVDCLLIPESEAELVETVKVFQAAGKPYRLLGNGSNILASDEGLKGTVIKTTRACMDLELAGERRVYAGASVKVQPFARFCINHNLEGLEYLYSVPATIGGAVFMNAGRGKTKQQQLSDHVESVRVFDGQRIFNLDKKDCAFRYRHSIFHHKRDWVILGAVFLLPAQDKEIGERKLRERMEFIKKFQDHKAASSGSIFKSGRNRVYRWVQGWKCGDAEFSAKATNWINNNGNAKMKDVMKLIRYAKLLNLLLFKRARVEIEIWK